MRSRIRGDGGPSNLPVAPSAPGLSPELGLSETADEVTHPRRRWAHQPPGDPERAGTVAGGGGGPGNLLPALSAPGHDGWTRYGLARFPTFPYVPLRSGEADGPVAPETPTLSLQQP